SQLLQFASRARGLRSQGLKGAPMPPAQAENWSALLANLDGFLARSAAQTSSFDLIRARVVLEAEIEDDGRAYGDFPDGLADSVVEHVTRVAVRMAQVRALGERPARRSDFVWPVDPVAVT